VAAEAPEARRPLAALAGRDSATFVLARAEAQAAEPIITSDVICAGVRYQHALRDTVTLWADGRARVASAMVRLRNGTALDAWHAVATGRWAWNARADVHYYAAAPSVVLTASYPGQAPVEFWLRVAGETAVTRLASMGGSCGTDGGGRVAEWTYTRR
jgi:hypothetical protein